MRLQAARRHFVVDTDGGFDDCLAIGALASFESIALVTCSFGVGGAPARVASRVRSVLRRLGCNAPVAVGASKPLRCSPQAALSRGSAWSLNMIREMDVWAAEQGLVDEEQQVTARLALLETLREHEGDLDFVGLGPLTNFAAWSRDPEVGPLLNERMRRLWIMGGTLKAEGNTPVCTEYNFYADPGAAGAVLEHRDWSSRIRLLGLDVCHSRYAGFLDQSEKLAKQGGVLGSTQAADFCAMVYDPVVAYAAAADGSNFHWTRLHEPRVDKDTGRLFSSNATGSSILVATDFSGRGEFFDWLQAAVRREQAEMERSSAVVVLSRATLAQR